MAAQHAAQAVTGDKIHESSASDAEPPKKNSIVGAPALQDFKITPAETSDNANIFSQGGKNYRTLGKWDTVLILFTNQIGLGVLSLPSVMKTLGVVPGIIAMVGIGGLTWYAAYVLLQFYRKHPHVVNMVDMCTVVGGKRFELVAGIMNVVQFIFFAASPAVTLSVAFNTISDHAACTVVFIFVACAFSWIFSLPRTMKFVSMCGIPNAISVLVAVGIALISLVVAGPSRAPDDWHRKIEVVGNPTFREGLNACLKIVYAYAANCTFVSYMAEMVDPARDFKFSLCVLEISSMVFYVSVALVLYCLAGEYTVSPVLGSASRLPAKIAYGIALFAILTTAFSNAHTGCKYIYVLSMRKLGAVHQLTDNSMKSWGCWVTIVTGFWVVVFVLSNAIPIFDSILSITSATTVSWFTYGFSAIFWLNLNWGSLTVTWKKTALTCLNSFLIIISLFVNGAGLWSSVTDLMDAFDSKDSSVTGVFSCGNNAVF
ncbi:transmembrane amino acid transporter protein-domain-containing protein [Thelonectria olida]|uniref:Transmembrane amino acid transporter protein-domain-containing protein n=1 Tax=Thelonectria olida TaxID=1576542 RepID=A0A9P8W7B7_9HYPO|nr:transmembrane amino acid transporter protein-domain-containing protein [Thelonectria olida]